MPRIFWDYRIFVGGLGKGILLLSFTEIANSVFVRCLDSKHFRYLSHCTFMKTLWLRYDSCPVSQMRYMKVWGMSNVLKVTHPITEPRIKARYWDGRTHALDQHYAWALAQLFLPYAIHKHKLDRPQAPRMHELGLSCLGSLHRPTALHCP